MNGESMAISIRHGTRMALKPLEDIDKDIRPRESGIRRPPQGLQAIFVRYGKAILKKERHA